jgi:PAS domain S-box-containing protein
MKKWTIKRLVLTGFAAAVLILVLLAGIAWQSIMKSLAVSTRQNHSNTVLIATEKISSSMALAIAAHRGYILSGDQESLLQREAALEALHASLNSLTELTRDDLEQQAHLQQVRKVIPERIASFTASDALLQKADLPGGSRKISAADAASERLQSILGQMVSHEKRLLQQHEAAARSGMLHAQISGALLLAFLAVFLGSLYLLISRNIRRDETRAALEKSEALLRQILELLPVGVFVAERDGRISLINPAGHAIWGTSSNDMPQTPAAYHAWRLDNRQKIEPHEFSILRALYHGETTLNQEFDIMRTDGTRKILRTSSMPLRDSQQHIIGAITVNMDVTDLKRTEEQLQAAHHALEARVAIRTRELVIANAQLTSQIEERRRAEEALRRTQNILTNAQRVARVGGWEINLVTQEVQWSDEFFRICGLEPGAIKPTIAAGFKLIHPDDHDMIANLAEQGVRQGKPYEATLRLIRPDGTMRHVLLQGEPVVNGKDTPTKLIGSLLDITEQRQNEEMLRQLAVHQQTIKEAERKRIAREIHDEMGQNLLALRIDVSMLHARTQATHPRLHRKVETVLANIDNTIKSVRAIINNLRPAVLDLGLYASFQWQINEFERRNGITCELFAKADELDRGLTEEQTTALFRILQESLTNVARHANANCVQIVLTRLGNQLQMKIADDGVGIYPNERRNAKSFGLLGMRERIAAIGGKLSVDSTVGQGTVLTLTIPLDTQHAPALEQDTRLPS